MKNKGVLWVAQTAVLVALLVGGQAASASFGQLVTGSYVNFILIVSVVVFGPASGLAVACLSPVFARLLGIGPLWSLIFFMMAANAALVLIWHYMGTIKSANVHIVRIFAVIAAAAGKFTILYTGIVRLAVPLILKLPGPQAAAVSGIFSIPQFFTASIGGALALAVLPVIEKAVKKNSVTK
jgi:uncharacterized membrane protein